MALLQGQNDIAQQYHDRFLSGSVLLDKLCWSDSLQFYVNVGYDPNNWNAIGDGTLIDMLLGQTWAYILGLGYLLPKPHVQLAIEAIWSFNHQVGFNPKNEGPRIYMDERDSGLWVCRWPNNNPPSNPILYNSECWSGVEYPVATNALYEKYPFGLTIIDDIRARQDGTRRSPWNEVECGDHYSRQQSSWMTYEAATGVQYNAPKGTISFAPIINQTQFQCFYITGHSWGTFKQSGNGTLSKGAASLNVAYGSLFLNSLGLVSSALKVTASLDGNNVQISTSAQNGQLIITFIGGITVPLNSTLAIVLG